MLDALFPRTRQQILAALLLRPERSWSMSELARHLHVGPSTLQRELSSLITAGLLLIERRGRMVLHRANPSNPVLRDLQGLLLKTAGLVDVVREALEPLRDSICLAFVHGSVAAGDVHAESDVDLIIVGAARSAEIAKALRPLQQRLDREVNFKVYSQAQFEAKRDAGDHFLSNVLRKPKIMIFGDEHDLDPTGSGKTS